MHRRGGTKSNHLYYIKLNIYHLNEYVFYLKKCIYIYIYISIYFKAKCNASCIICFTQKSRVFIITIGNDDDNHQKEGPVILTLLPPTMMHTMFHRRRTTCVVVAAAVCLLFVAVAIAVDVWQGGPYDRHAKNSNAVQGGLVASSTAEQENPCWVTVGTRVRTVC